MDESRLTEYYSEIANKLNEMIPCEWEQIYYLGEVEAERSGWSSVFYFKPVDSDEFVRSYDIPDKYDVSEEIYDQLRNEADEILLEIYDCFVQDSQEPWEQLSLSLDSTGRFNMNYLYDAISGNARGPMEREVIWAYDTFGYMPKEGTYRRELLDAYLKDRR